MNQTTRNTGVGVMHSEKMVCVDCFRSKGDGDLKLACQNPRCHFYYKEDLHQSVFSRTFSKEVGYDRKKSDLSQTPGDFLSPTHSSKMWAYRPSSPRLLKVPQVSSQKIRSKSTSATTGGTVNIRKLLTCHQQVPFVISKDEETSALHSRVTSLPEYIDSASVDESGELVEDTFLCSPLSADYLEKDRVSCISLSAIKADVDDVVCSLTLMQILMLTVESAVPLEGPQQCWTGLIIPISHRLTPLLLFLQSHLQCLHLLLFQEVPMLLI